MDTTILWKEERNFGQIGPDFASANFTAYSLTTEDAGDKVLVEGTIRVGHYENFGELYERNDTVNTAPLLAIQYTGINGRTALVRQMIKQADAWFAECDHRLEPARKVAEHS